jgi:hypothetical protein
MSVLRKRSPWIIPSIGLSLGLLALGLTGCGGGNEGLPSGPGTITVPPVASFTVSTIPVNTGTVVSTAIPANQGGTVSSNGLDAATFGTTGVTLTVNPGSITSDTTLGIQVRPKSESVITQAKSEGKAGDVSQSLVEFDFGAVGSDGKIDTSRPIVFSGSITFTLTPAQLQTAINAGRPIQFLDIDPTTHQSTTLIDPATGLPLELSISQLQALLNSGNNPVTITQQVSGAHNGTIAIVVGPEQIVVHGQGGVG